MLKYSATLTSALEYGKAEKTDAWVHLYLNEEGRNIPFSDGLKLFDRYFISPAQFPLSFFQRCAGPEETEYNDFMSKYGEYVKDCTVVRR